MSNLQVISDIVYSTESDFKARQADPSMDFEREAGFAIQVLTASDYASKLAINARQSVINAVHNIAAVGISLNPAKKQAYLVPRKGQICLDISYMGLIDIAVESGSILWAQADLVYEGDSFELVGVDKAPIHKRDPFSTERGAFRGVYVVAKTRDGDYLTTTMSAADVDNIKNRSESVKGGKSSPWFTDFGEMAKKTVVKRAYKYWPKSDRLDQAIHHLNTDGGEGLAPQPVVKDMGAAEVVSQFSTEEIESAGMALVDEAKKGIEALKAAWKALSVAMRAEIKKTDYYRQADEAALAAAQG